MIYLWTTRPLRLGLSCVDVGEPCHSNQITRPLVLSSPTQVLKALEDKSTSKGFRSWTASSFDGL